jgi:hypothetical protein
LTPANRISVSVVNSNAPTKGQEEPAVLHILVDLLHHVDERAVVDSTQGDHDRAGESVEEAGVQPQGECRYHQYRTLRGSMMTIPP